MTRCAVAWRVMATCECGWPAGWERAAVGGARARLPVFRVRVWMRVWVSLFRVRCPARSISHMRDQAPQGRRGRWQGWIRTTANRVAEGRRHQETKRERKQERERERERAAEKGGRERKTRTVRVQANQPAGVSFLSPCRCERRLRKSSHWPASRVVAGGLALSCVCSRARVWLRDECDFWCWPLGWGERLPIQTMDWTQSVQLIWKLPGALFRYLPWVGRR